MSLHRALNQLGRLLRETNRPAEAEALFRRTLVNDEKLDEQHVFTDLVNLGWVLHDTSRLVEAEPLLRRALALTQSYGPNHEQARALNSLGALLKETNRLAEAETLFRRALPLSESLDSIPMSPPHWATWPVCCRTPTGWGRQRPSIAALSPSARRASDPMIPGSVLR